MGLIQGCSDDWKEGSDVSPICPFCSRSVTIFVGYWSCEHNAITADIPAGRGQVRAESSVGQKTMPATLSSTAPLLSTPITTVAFHYNEVHAKVKWFAICEPRPHYMKSSNVSSSSTMTWRSRLRSNPRADVHIGCRIRQRETDGGMTMCLQEMLQRQDCVSRPHTAFIWYLSQPPVALGRRHVSRLWCQANYLLIR